MMIIISGGGGGGGCNGTRKKRSDQLLCHDMKWMEKMVSFFSLKKI